MYFVVTWAALLPREGSHLPLGRLLCVVAHTLHPWEAEDFVCPGPPAQLERAGHCLIPLTTTLLLAHHLLTALF